jgi:hypothetical protein
MKRIVNAILFPFAKTVEMYPGCFVRYIGDRPVGYHDGKRWCIL